jgi:hypothetical protein
VCYRWGGVRREQHTFLSNGVETRNTKNNKSDAFNKTRE